MPSSPFVDRMATIQETADLPVPDNEPPLKFTRVADTFPKQEGPNSELRELLIAILCRVLFPALRIFMLLELFTYLSNLFVTAAEPGTGVSPMLFAIGQLLDLIPTITDTFVSVITTFVPSKSCAGQTGVFIAEGTELPKVDLVILTCKEPVDIIMDTVKSCIDLDYPKGKLRVIISDDGKDDTLKAQVLATRTVFENILYHRRERPKDVHHGFKAGNVNDTLNWLADQEGGAHPWVLNLDSDMILDREALKVLLGSALRDPEIGLATLPQDYYNIPVNDPLHQNLILQHQRDQVSRDNYNAAWCIGSGLIFTREAWGRVGGFPEFSMCEDLFFGWALNGAGYKTVHVNACHQCGLQPDTFQYHEKQRRRWYVGGMRNCIRLQFGIFQPLFKQMTWMQWIFVMNQMPKAFMITLFKGTAAILNFVCLVRGILYLDSVVNVATDQLPRILYAYAFYKMTTLAFESYNALNFGHIIRRARVVSTWQGLHLFKAAVDEYLPSCFGGYKLGFDSSGGRSDGVVLDERDASTRPSTGIRLNFAHRAERVLYHLVYFLIIGGVTFWNIHHIAWSARSYNTMFFWLVTGPLFPGLQIENVFAHLSPIFYFIKPPTMPDRLKMMYLDERTGGYRPLPELRGVKFTNTMWLWELWNFVAVAWSLAAFLIIDRGLDTVIQLICIPVGIFNSARFWEVIPLFLTASIFIFFVELVKEKYEERTIRAEIDATIAADATKEAEAEADAAKRPANISVKKVAKKID